MKEDQKVEPLLGAEDLLRELWPNEDSRPSLRWLREQQKRRAISHIKIGRRVFFRLSVVSAELEKKFTIRSSHNDA